MTLFLLASLLLSQRRAINCWGTTTFHFLSGLLQFTLDTQVVQDNRQASCGCNWGLGSHIFLTGPQPHIDFQGVDSQTDCSTIFLRLQQRQISAPATGEQPYCGVGSPTFFYTGPEFFAFNSNSNQNRVLQSLGIGLPLYTDWPTGVPSRHDQP